jgi:LmbE family N-acetylglucosaminyl deacetylase
MSEIVLVVVAHSDDESISMAGTIRKHIDSGDKVYVISMTDGVGARNRANQSLIFKRKEAANLASQILGFEWGECYDFIDNAMDSVPLLEVVKAVELAKRKYQPTLVYTHSSADLNIDHKVVANAVLTAFRPQPLEKCKEIRLFEVASSTDFGNPTITGVFNPNLFINITKNWDAKANALKAYKSEMRNYPHSRSVEGIMNLARIRGNQVGLNLAEAFEVIRKVEE